MAVGKYGKGALLTNGGETLLRHSLVLHMVLGSLPTRGSVSEHTLGQAARSGLGYIVGGLGFSQDWACLAWEMLP